MSVESLFFYIILPFLFLMGIMIAFFIYKTRVRKPEEIIFKTPSPPTFVQVDCTQKLLKEYAAKSKWGPLIFIAIPLGLYLFVMMCLSFNHPDTNLLEIGLILFVLLAIGSFLGFLSKRDILRNIKNAYVISKNKELVFKLTSEGFLVPTLLLAGPAFWRLGEKNLHEVMIPFSDIDTIEVYAGAGSAPAQFKINPIGASAILGKGRIGEHDGPQFGIGIKREILADSEPDILSFLNFHLKDRLMIRTDIKK